MKGKSVMHLGKYLYFLLFFLPKYTGTICVTNSNVLVFGCRITMFDYFAWLSQMSSAEEILSFSCDD